MKFFDFHKGCEVNDEKEKFHKCKGNHFHNSTLAHNGKNNKKSAENHKRNNSEKLEAFKLFNVEDKEKNNRRKGERYEKSSGNPMSKSFRVPICNAVAKGESYAAHADKTENAKNIQKFILIAEFFIHELSVHYNSA